MSGLPRATITLRNDRAEIPRLAAFIDGFCQPLRPAPEDLMSFHLALEEAVTNVIHHGYVDGQAHEFTVSLAAAPGGLVTAVVSDDAPAFDPVARPPVDTSLPLEERPIGGLGVHLIKNLMDSVRYERRDGRNLLTLEWRSVRPRPA
jgi:anti-sigma regulatory factor (Ser/Thr protein kinase)